MFEPAVREGIRVVWGRTGIVLAPDGGALESLLPIARAAAYGPIGSGKQGVPWIHIDDMVDAITFAITTPKAHGPINLVGHQSTSQRAFASALGRAVRRPAIAPAPSFAMRLLLGEAASALLEGQYVRPDRLQELGFKHRFRDLDDAFRDILSTDRVHIRSLNQTPDVNEGASYLRSAPPTHELTSARVVPQPPEAVWSFFSDARNLATLSPMNAGMTMGDAPSSVSRGARFCHRLSVGTQGEPSAPSGSRW